MDLASSVGYAIKRSQGALRNAMDTELRRYGLSVPQYSCLEILASRPNISNAELARGAFVSRQAMHQLLGGLLEAGLVISEGAGRNERYGPTTSGQRRLSEASRAVAMIEERMLGSFSGAQRARLQADLIACAEALTTATNPAVVPESNAGT